MESLIKVATKEESPPVITSHVFEKYNLKKSTAK